MSQAETNRRDVLYLLCLGAVAALPPLARAQQPRVWRVAYLSTGLIRNLRYVRGRMSELGYVEGKNLVSLSLGAEGEYDRLPQLAKQIMEFHPDAIVAEATAAIAAVQQLTTTIPIIMAPSNDPIESGFVQSYAKPGGNITGIANMFGDLTAKTLEILHEVLPQVATVAVLMSSNPTHPRNYILAQHGAETKGLSVVSFVARTPSELVSVFKQIEQAKCDALYVLADTFNPKISELAAATRIPAIYQYRTFVEDAGGLMSYGPDISAMISLAGDMLDKILKGAKPSDVPVQQPTTFELVLNLKAARELGLKIPASFIQLANRVVE
jgi:putative ABC transport system substrate-binding protein